MKSSDWVPSAWNQCFLLSYSLQPGDIVESHRTYFQIYFHHTDSWKDNSNVYKLLSRRKHSNVFRMKKQVAMLGDVTQELENLRINEKKQTRIEHFF